mmetsp:Transcript_22988/g.30580  ORF Transcript_22988/g.30580 Transcript_22988/m.30580 type:complete len:112 (+) Transcript_22988:296-631(+)
MLAFLEGQYSSSALLPRYEIRREWLLHVFLQLGIADTAVDAVDEAWELEGAGRGGLSEQLVAGQYHLTLLALSDGRLLLSLQLGQDFRILFPVEPELGKNGAIYHTLEKGA